MRLFDFFKGKKTKKETTIVDNSSKNIEKCDFGAKDNVDNSSIVTEKLINNKNEDFEEKDDQDFFLASKDEKYCTEVHTLVQEETNIFSEPYNEVKAYVEFMNKYTLIDSPQTHNPTNYAYFQFLNAGLHNVSDVRKCHEELFDKGFYEECNDPSAFLELMSVSALKELANRMGLEVKGRKSDIQEAIANATTYDELKNIFGYGLYHPSIRAEEYKKEHQIEIEYYFQLKDESISFEDFSEDRKTKSLDDINFPSYKKSAKGDDFYYGTSDYEWIAEYYRRKNDLKKTAEFYLKVLFIELSGVQLNNVNRKDFKKDHTPKENWPIWNIKINVNIVNKIQELKDQIDEALLSKVTSFKIPFNACPPNLFSEIVGLIKDDKFDKTTSKRVSYIINENLVKIRNDF